MIEPGRYHEEVTITNKNNLVITADPDNERPVLDGTVVLNPEERWREETIGRKVVCVGKIKITNDKHPFQLFLNEGDDYEMMTNARWPNALWAEKNAVTGAPNVFYNKFWAKSDLESTRGKMIDRKRNLVSPLAETGLDMTGAMAVLNVGSFNTFVKPVKDHQAGSNFFTYDDDFDNIKFEPKLNQYYLDSSEVLLDVPGEWYYNMQKRELKFMPLSGKCPDRNSDAVRGRVMDYFFNITNTNGLKIEHLDFFASNLQAVTRNRRTGPMEVDNLHLDSLRFRFPSSSKRMLGDYAVPKVTRLIGNRVGQVAVTNCEFVGAEGGALYNQANITIHNSLFKWNDWSGQMALTSNGGFGTVFSKHRAGGESFIGNTLLHNGASSGYFPGHQPTITDNLIIGQCDGEIMSDGSGIQVSAPDQQSSFVARNWVLESPKRGIRFDGDKWGKRSGDHGTLQNNVIWNVAAYMIKGDYHNITGNLALKHDKRFKGDRYVFNWGFHEGMQIMNIYGNKTNNNHTLIQDNASWHASGGRNNRLILPVPGTEVNNYFQETIDGGKLPESVTDMLVDVKNFDFRPRPQTILTSTGRQIGPYPVECTDKKYAIPGRKEEKPSFPIPASESIVGLRDSLMFRPAFRCTDQNDKHLVYIAEMGATFAAVDEPTLVLIGDQNVILFKEIGFSLIPDRTYKWRVDCLDGDTGIKQQTGDVWSFTMAIQ